LASRDAIFFSASAAHANEQLLWVVFFMIGAVGITFGPLLLSHEYPEYGRFLKVPSAALGIVSCLLAPGALAWLSALDGSGERPQTVALLGLSCRRRWCRQAEHAWMRPEREREPKPAPPSTSPTNRVLPMHLQLGNCLSDETGEWEVIGCPYTTASGKIAARSHRGSICPFELGLSWRWRRPSRVGTSGWSSRHGLIVSGSRSATSYASEIKRRFRTTSVFEARAFRELVAAAQRSATRRVAALRNVRRH
jgi:hypothetical protein